MSHSLNTVLNKPGGKLMLLGLLAALAMGWMFLSGMAFLILIDRDPNQTELLTLYQYWYYYRSNPVVMHHMQLAGLIGLGIIFLPMLLLLMPASQSKNKLFGDARFAGAGEIKKAGLMGDKGIIVGSYGGKYLMFPGQQHAIISAPTRSGKGVGIVIPNLLNWPESIVVLDIKQ